MVEERAGSKPRVGVLGIQGDIEKHLSALAAVGAIGERVLHPKDLKGLAGLILPGGESTTISKGLDRHGLVAPIRDFAAAGGRVLGTCAGAILLSSKARNHPVPTLGLIDIEAERNAYGTQLDSFIAPADAASGPEWAGMRCVFIRAPRLIPGEDASPAPKGETTDRRLAPAGDEPVQILACVDGEPVLVRQGRRWACTFHPELTGHLRVHRAFLESAFGAARTS